MNEETLNRIKAYLPAYVKSITKKAPNGGYICPVCGSGTGNNGTGAFSVNPDGIHWKCFSGKHTKKGPNGGDIFELIGQVEHIQGFKEKMKRACDITGIQDDGTETGKPALKPEPEKEPAPTAKPYQFDSLIMDAHRHAGNTDYWEQRGITEDTVNRFTLGFKEEIYFPNDHKSHPAVIIPYSDKHMYFTARATDQKLFYKPSSEKAGMSEPLFNAAALYGDKPVFICESAIDAISIMQVCPECEAIATGGKNSTSLARQIAKRLPTVKIIINPDNDSAGMEICHEREETLKAAGIRYTIAEYSYDRYSGPHKDANDLLRANPSLFKEEIKANIERREKLEEEEKKKALEDYRKITARGRLSAFQDSIVLNTIHPISTGFSNLDRELDGGIYPGALYIIGAVSSLGKTTMLLQMADQIAASGTDCLYISLEMSANELMAKSVSRYTYTINRSADKPSNGYPKTVRGITTYSRYQYYSDGEKKLIDEAINAYGKGPAMNMYIYEGIGDIGAEAIREKVKQHIEITGHRPVIFIDYLQILAPADVRASDKTNTDKAVLTLKRTARDMDVPIIAVSSFNRESYSTYLTMSAFKESGAIEYGSDVLMGIQPQGMERGNGKDVLKNNAQTLADCKEAMDRAVECVILKNRNGKTGGKACFTYHAKYNVFEVSMPVMQ